jgi:glycosyltransferase involved in cell wall biosynthesis
MKCSVIVPTYNRPAVLKLCLLSLTMQSRLPDEVLIADDGSGQETRDQIDSLRPHLESFFPVKHVWHEDIGFRKPKILNESVRQSSGDYLIFIDGDCIAHRHFVKAHLDRSSPEAVLGGKRVEIGRELSERIMKEGKVYNAFRFGLLWDAARKRSRRVGESFYITSKLLRRMLHRDRMHDRAIWGCNFSLYKELFYAINGSDEDFVDGSVEDIDIGIRAVNQGKRLVSVRALAIIFHLWHRSSWNYESEKYKHNLGILQRRMDNKERYCLNGIKKLS